MNTSLNNQPNTTNNNANGNTSLDINAPINLSTVSVSLAPITLQS